MANLLRLRLALQQVSRTFPASIPGLHSRAALAVATLSDDTLSTKIALVPLGKDRTSVQRITDSLLLTGMPVPLRLLAENEQEWLMRVQHRNLSKDTRIQAGSHTALTVTNGMQLYEVPSPYLTTNNLVLNEAMHEPKIPDDLYEPCHLYVFISSSVSSLTQSLPNALVPAIRVIDVDSAAIESTTKLAGSSAIVVSSLAAAESRLTDDMWSEKSQISLLASVLSDRSMVESSLLNSVIEACKVYVEEAKLLLEQSGQTAKSQTMKDVEAARGMWAEAAHVELRDVLEPGLVRFAQRTAWWKLYWTVDDIEEGPGREDVLMAFLPYSERGLMFILGKLSNFPQVSSISTLSDTRGVSDVNFVGTSVSSARSRIHYELLPSLHAIAQKTIVNALLEVQIPLVVLGASGWLLLDLSGVGMTGLALLGMVIGFKRVQKSWDAAISEFTIKVRDLAQGAIDQGEAEMHGAFEARVQQAGQRIEEQERVLRELRETVTEP
ncbi:uncharacterized protein V1516DRAFT_680732 [Lipomyces oligophaga]|uniref:uncharacterized protein n=1 Tax=Lipomyces oligophaga TaxID=45792 RepID=UPI0034CE79A2